MTVDFKPDFGPEELEDWASPAQLESLEKLIRYGWRCTHLWEMNPGEIIVWCITRPANSDVKTDTFLHAYITPAGLVLRYDPKRGV